MVSASLLSLVAALQSDDIAPRLEVPAGFTASLYASGIRGARDLDVRDDGTLTLRRGVERLEIAPATAVAPVTVMRVAAELAAPDRMKESAVAVQSPGFVRMRWDAAAGELAYALRPAASTGISVSPRMMALARELARRRDADVAMAPDGSLFVAESQAGAVWHIRRSTL